MHSRARSGAAAWDGAAALALLAEAALGLYRAQSCCWAASAFMTADCVSRRGGNQQKSSLAVNPKFCKPVINPVPCARAHILPASYALGPPSSQQ